MLAVGLASLLAGSACTSGGSTGGLAVQDSGAVKACTGLRAVIHDRAAGTLGPAALRARLSDVYDASQTSSNTILRTRAVALFADATNLVVGGDASSLSSDLDAMAKSCNGQGP